MNCQDFNDRLHEYRDEGMGADVWEHLRQCDHCRCAYVREEAIAKSIRHSLDRATAGLSLRPATEQNILKTLQSNPVRSNPWLRAWQRLMSAPLRPIGAGAALLVVLLLLLNLPFHRRATEDSIPQATAQTGQDICVIDVPLQTRTHVFRRQDNNVVDGIAVGVAVGHALFPTNPDRSLKPL